MILVILFLMNIHVIYFLTLFQVQRLYFSLIFSCCKLLKSCLLFLFLTPPCNFNVISIKFGYVINETVYIQLHLIGDGIYKYHNMCLTPFSVNEIRNNSILNRSCKLNYNKQIRHYRVRVEHVFGHVREYW